MRNDFPGYNLEYINKEEKKRLFGLLSPIKEEAEMSPQRIQQCLDGIEDAVTHELENYGIEREKISTKRIEGSERRIKAKNSEFELEVSAVVEDTRKGSWEENYQSPGPALRSDARTGVARHTGEKVKNGKITTHYRFESDSEEHQKLYSNLADRLMQLTEELGLSKGDFFGRMPRGKSVMS